MLHSLVERTGIAMQNNYGLVVLCVMLLSSAGCQKSIPLDNLIATHKSNTSTRKSTKKLSLNEAIKQQKLGYADNLYLEYRGEHPDSGKIPAMILKLSKAHIREKEYLLARYYAEAYITDYPDRKNVDLAWFLRLKSLFLRFRSPGSVDSLGEQFQEEARVFISDPFYRKYHAKVRDMLKETKKIQHQRNEALARYYEKLGKPKAAAFYRQRDAASKEKE